MVLNLSSKLFSRQLSFFIFVFCMLTPQWGLAQEEPTEDPKTFPGFNEVVPQATALAAKLTEVDNRIQNFESREALYARLDNLQENLSKLENTYEDWDKVAEWPINRLLRAQASYIELEQQQTAPMNQINIQLNELEQLRITWENENSFWREWREHLRNIDVKVPDEAFNRSLGSIQDLLKRISRIGGELVKAQQKYAPGSEVITSRLRTIEKTLDRLRRDSLKCNTYSVFETGYYQQFTSELFGDFSYNLSSSMNIPINSFKRHAGELGLLLVFILCLSSFLLYQRSKSKLLSDEWQFLSHRPFSTALFISISFLGLFATLFKNFPLSWRLMILIVVTVSAMRLLNAFYRESKMKTAIRITAAVFIITESLRYFGLPTPLLQLYNTLLCCIAISVFTWLLRKRFVELEKLRFLIYLLAGTALIALLSALFGFENLSTNLIDATLSTLILLLLLKMTLQIGLSGIESLMQVEWIKKRHFIQILGLEEATNKLQTLLRIFIFLHAGLYLMVIWLLTDNLTEAREKILGLEYTFGEFSISVKMVVMVIVVLYLTTIISWVIQAFIDSQIMSPRKMDIGVKESLKRLTHYGLFTIGFLVAISMAGLDLQKLTILAGALGVGIGFGLQNIVNNFVSGLILLFERPVKVGDTINIGTDWGVIKHIGLRSTIFETFERSEIIVPNAELISQNVTNWTYSTKVVRVNLPVGVAYGSPLEKVLEILIKAAKEHQDVLQYPEPNAVFDGYGSSSIDFTLRFWIHTIDDRLRIRTEVAVIIDRLFREEDIVIPFPQRDLHLRSVDSNLHSLFGTKAIDPPNEDKGNPE